MSEFGGSDGGGAAGSPSPGGGGGGEMTLAKVVDILTKLSVRDIVCFENSIRGCVCVLKNQPMCWTRALHCLLNNISTFLSCSKWWEMPPMNIAKISLEALACPNLQNSCSNSREACYSCPKRKFYFSS